MIVTLCFQAESFFEKKQILNFAGVKYDLI